MVYAATLRESQRVMRWQLILKYFGPNIQHTDGVYNTVSDTSIRLPYTPSDKYKSCTSKAQCHVNKLFAISRVKNNEDYFQLNLLIVHRK